MNKKLVMAGVVTAVVAVSLLVLIRSQKDDVNIDTQNMSDVKNDANQGKDRTPEWLKTKELNQKLVDKSAVYGPGNPDKPLGKEDTAILQDERIGKEDPSMIEHLDPASLPPLDMISTEEQEKFNREMTITQEEADKKINQAEMHPDPVELDKQVDMKAMNPDINTVRKLIEETEKSNSNKK